MKLYSKTMLGALAALSLSAGLSAHADTGSDIYSTVLRSTVRVLAQKADGSSDYGTGWIVTAADKENRAGAAVIITAAHVVDGATKITIIESGQSVSQQKAATLINETSERDIAFLEVRGLTEQPLELTRAVPKLGAHVDAFGYSGASDYNEVDQVAVTASLKAGIVSKTFSGPMNANAQGAVDQLEYDAPILAGFSGGPVLDENGLVVGLTLKDGGHVQLDNHSLLALGQGVDVAISANEIIKAANDARVDLTIGSATPPPKPPCLSQGVSTLPSGEVCVPLQESPNPIRDFLKHWQGAIIAAAVIAILCIAGLIAFILKWPASLFTPAATGAPQPAPGGQTTVAQQPERQTRRIQLTGRGPSGEPINLNFTSDELVSSGYMMGVAASVRIPDNRPEPFVSRQHARIFFDGVNFMVDDNKSTNKTKVGDQALDHGRPHALFSGDTVSLADIRLHVSVH